VGAIGLGAAASGDLGVSNVFDGDLDTFTLARGAPPWISVQLGAPTLVTKVIVHNRADAYAYLLGSFTVWVSDVYASGAAGVDVQTFQQCGGLTTGTATAGPFVVECSSALRGSYVTVRQQSDGSSVVSGFLTPTEIEVRSYRASVLPPPPPPSPPPLPSPPAPPLLPACPALPDGFPETCHLVFPDMFRRCRCALTFSDGCPVGRTLICNSGIAL